MQIYSLPEYLRDRSQILKEMAAFQDNYPLYDINYHTGPSRLKAILKDFKLFQGVNQ
jgi:hypothetical protein